MADTALVGTVTAKTLEGEVKIGELGYSDLAVFTFAPRADAELSEDAEVCKRVIVYEWTAFQEGYKSGGCTFDNSGVCRTPTVASTADRTVDGVTKKIAQLDPLSAETLCNIVSDLTNGLTDLVLPGNNP